MSDERLFISHASDDTAAVEPIVAYLEAHGVPCWIASRDIPPRSIYAEEITKGIEECAACAVIVSEAANKSGAIKRELELASHHNKPFIPIRIDGAEPGRGLDYYLRNTQWIDYRRERERGLDRIVRHVKREPATLISTARPLSATPAPTESTETASPLPWLLVLVAIFVLAVLWTWLGQSNNITDTTSQSAAIETAAPATDAAAAPATTATDPAAPTAAQAAERARREARLPRTQWIQRVRSEPIIPGQTMAGVRLGETTEEDVIAMLGPPDRRTSGSLEYGTEALRLYFDWNGGLSYIGLTDRELLLSGLMPTLRGVGIGSPIQRATGAIATAPSSHFDNCYYWNEAGLYLIAPSTPSGRIDSIGVMRPSPGNDGCE